MTSIDPLPEDVALLAAAPLVTGRYQTFDPTIGVPVRSTVGYPRFWRHGPLLHAREITPFGIFGSGLDDDAARAAYLDRLDGQAGSAVGVLATIAREHPGRLICVLCFEDVHAGHECHRRWFADWCEDRFGLVVPELDTPS